MISEPMREIIVEILKKNGVKKAAIFGSFARGEEKKNSDIDILVEVPEGMGIFEFVRLERELKNAVGRKVDMVSYDALHPLLKDVILREQKMIYG